MNGRRREPLDVISLIATAVPPIWVAFRLVTGGWATRIILLMIVMAVAAFYWFVIRPRSCHVESAAESDDDSAALKDLESQAKKISPLFMAAITGTYVFVLILCAIAGSLVAK